jgi:hypothetical protein
MAQFPEGRGFDSRRRHWNSSLKKSSRSNISDVDNIPHQKASRVMLVESTVNISYHAPLCDDILCPLMYSPSVDVTSLSPSDKHKVQSGTNVSTV